MIGLRAACLGILLASPLLAPGCGGAPGRVRVQDSPPRPVAQVDVVGLRLTPPAPVNWDEKPGFDGLQVQVNFFRLDEDLSVTVKGSLELALYEGKLKKEQLADARPLHTWRFSGVELVAHCGKSAFGWGYAMRLPWGAAVPTGSNATLVAKYTSPEGKTTTAEPIVVPMSPAGRSE